MRHRSPFLVAAFAMLSACGSFGTEGGNVAPDGSVGTTDASDTSDAPSGDAAPSDAAAPTDGASADGPVVQTCDTTFCDDFESGDLAAATMRWGMLESSAATTAAVMATTSPTRRFFHVATQTTANTYARLTHPIGAITPTTDIDLRFAVRLLSAAESEIVAFNLFDGSGVIAADLTIRASTNGALRISYSKGGAYTDSGPTAPVDGGAWHSVKLLANASGASLTVDSNPAVPVAGSPLPVYPDCRFSAGAYLLANGAAAVVELDDIRLAVQ